MPRDYVSRLEAQVTKLNQELQALKAQLLPDAGALPIEVACTDIRESSSSTIEIPTTADSNSSHLQDLATSVTNGRNRPSTQSRFLGPSSGIALAKLVMAAIRVDDVPSFFPEKASQRPYDPSLTVQEPTACFPPRNAADHLVDVYFQYRTPHLPIIDRQQVEEALEIAYSSNSDHSASDRVIENSIFTTYMIFAIALCDLPNPVNPASKGRPSQSEGCFLSALVWVEKVVTYSKSDLEKLRSILLLAQFIALNPSRGSLWHLTGTALRLCIDIGLHWETEEQALNMSPDLLYDRQRLWYCTYQFDRLLSVTLDRPFGIIDESTRVPRPNPWARARKLGSSLDQNEVHTQRAHNHIFGMSMLESEIKHVQHNQTWATKLASPKVNYTAWIFDIQPRLHEWYDTIPQLDKAHPSSIFAEQAYWDSIYHNTILLLYRPNPTATNLSTEAIFVTFESSCKLIASIKILQRKGKCESLWKTVHHLFMAGLGVIYGLWQSKELRDRNPVSGSISTLQSCSSTLAAMSETFPGASGCRDIFDTLSAATIDFLVTHSAEEERRTRAEFEKQVGDLLQNANVSAASDSSVGNFNLSAMLSADGFASGEMLSSAAQWPEVRDLSFGDFDADLMAGIVTGSSFMM